MGGRSGKPTKSVIDGELIKIARELDFPEFSNEGEYLVIHSLQDILEQLGGQEDDYKNFFTARMLLLLESRPIHNDGVYNRIIEQIVRAYFRDYHDHVKEFRPIFLVNDILRFWKTLCLNYEKKRNIAAADRGKRNKNHLRNLKLKFSRLLTCFSTVIPIMALPSSSPDEIIALTKMPPLQRLHSVAGSRERTLKIYGDVVQQYAWFLETTAKADIVDWIGDKSNRKSAFVKADAFGAAVFSLLESVVTTPETYRFLII